MRGEAAHLSSLTYFKPTHMSLNSSHPMWTMAESPFEMSKVFTVASMISGRFLTDYRARHWSKSNSKGFCQLCLLAKQPKPTVVPWSTCCCGALLLLSLGRMLSLIGLTILQFLAPIITSIPGPEGESLHMQILLDPSTCPLVISEAQKLGSGILFHLFYLTRTWCHSHQLKRKKLLRLYNII